MKNRTLLLIIFIFLGTLSGVFFFLIQREVLIIHWNLFLKKDALKSLTNKYSASRKKVSYYFWKEERFQVEEGVLLWEADDVAENLKNLISQWLTCLSNEKILVKDVLLESVALSALQEEVVLSFSAPLLSKEWSISKKWHIIESLLKTIKKSGIKVNSIIFLVNDDPMDDDHLDFSQPYPLDGFLDDSR